MHDPLAEAAALAQERADRRKAKDFSAADVLRERIRGLGFEVLDEPEGFRLAPLVPRRVRPEDVTSVSNEPPTAEFSVQWVVQGWPEDVVRGIESFRRFEGERRIQHVVVDVVGTDPSSFPSDAEVILLEDDFGWAADRNAGLRRATGSIVVVVDGSVEAEGDVFGPLLRVFMDPAVGVAGPFGLVTEDMHEFHECPGVGTDRRVDAIEGYLIAFRREILEAVGPFDEKFKFYRTADIEFSFRVKDRGYQAAVVPLPVTRHEHRMWETTPIIERDRLSKRNFYRFLERWRGRTDLSVRGSSGP